MYWYLKENTQELWAWTQMFTPEQCETLISAVIDNYEPTRAKTVSEEMDPSYNDNNRNSCVVWLDMKDFETTYKYVTDIVNSINSQYFGYDITYLEQLQFTIYDSDKNQHFGAHIDSITGQPYPRKLSFTCQLSDPDSYEGGDLKIYETGKPIIAEKSQGRATFFNSNILHEVTPVTKGTRYSLVGWSSGPPFK